MAHKWNAVAERNPPKRSTHVALVTHRKVSAPDGITKEEVPSKEEERVPAAVAIARSRQPKGDVARGVARRVRRCETEVVTQGNDAAIFEGVHVLTAVGKG